MQLGEDQFLGICQVGNRRKPKELTVLTLRYFSVMDSPRRPPLRSDGRNLAELSDSRADSPYTDLESNYGCGDTASTDGWNPQIERCMSCISKLGALSRSSTATVTIGAPCWEHACDRHSLSSGSDSSGWSQAVTRPPARPPRNCPSPSPKKAMSVAGTTYDNYDIPKIPYPVVSFTKAICQQYV